MNVKELQYIIKQGENEWVEFKTSFNQQVIFIEKLFLA